MTHNPVGWFEIYVRDMDRAKKFYETVLSVRVEALDAPEGSSDIEMLAFPMEAEGKGAAGALVKMDGFTPGTGGTLIYFTSEDCAVEAARVESAGGTLHRDKESIGQYGFIALAFDTEGNMFGVHSRQ